MATGRSLSFEGGEEDEVVEGGENWRKRGASL